MLGCSYPDATYAELDAEQLVIDYRWENLISDEGWEVFGQVPSDEGWRVYLADSTITYSSTFEGQGFQDSNTHTAHVAVNDDNDVIWFTACTVDD